VPSKVDVSSETVSAGRPWWLDLLLTRSPGPWRSALARVAMLLVIIAGAGLTVYSGYIHLYLWGRQPFPYKDVPTIGPLFLLQGIVAIGIGLLVAVTRRLYAVLIGAGLMVLSVAALVFDVEVGMFGFQDSWSVPYATSTLYEEIAGAVVLLIAAAVLAWKPRRAIRAGDR
jgi:peptidoglycan biosynthesis protein MviN/MurJ (putative lipid II flippase)